MSPTFQGAPELVPEHSADHGRHPVVFAAQVATSTNGFPVPTTLSLREFGCGPVICSPRERTWGLQESPLNPLDMTIPSERLPVLEPLRYAAGAAWYPPRDFRSWC